MEYTIPLIVHVTNYSFVRPINTPVTRQVRSIKNQINMSIWRVILSIFCPPLAVIDKGCGSVVITFLLWICGWVPGVIAALVILNNPRR